MSLDEKALAANTTSAVILIRSQVLPPCQPFLHNIQQLHTLSLSSISTDPWNEVEHVKS
jgi:hypothetical protein